MQLVNEISLQVKISHLCHLRPPLFWFFFLPISPSVGPLLCGFLLCVSSLMSDITPLGALFSLLVVCPWSSRNKETEDKASLLLSPPPILSLLPHSPVPLLTSPPSFSPFFSHVASFLFFSCFILSSVICYLSLTCSLFHLFFFFMRFSFLCSSSTVLKQSSSLLHKSSQSCCNYSESRLSGN